MARIDSFEPAKTERNTILEPVAATVAVFGASDVATYLQIDTYDSAERKNPGKKSQPIQLSPAGLAELRAILDSL